LRLNGDASPVDGEEQSSVQRDAFAPGHHLPKAQKALLLRDCKQPYDLVTDHQIPTLREEHEVLVQTAAIGLNPIDWKAP
jgi:hypothetical protein